MTSIDDLYMRECIRESNLIEGVSDPVEVDQSMEAWRLLVQADGVTHSVVKNVQAVIVANDPRLGSEQRGAYRDLTRFDGTVGDYVLPRWFDVQGLMDDWLDGVTLRTSWINHVYFESIHPFCDGNGRTGRMLMWFDQIGRGEQPSLVRAAGKWDYYRSIAMHRRLHALHMAEGGR